MEAANQGGIPTVMIVDKAGKLAWIGHPRGGMDDALKQIMAGTYDMASAAQKAADQAKVAERNGKLESELRAAVKKKDFAQALKVADQMLATDPEGFAGVAFYKYRLLLVEMKDTAAAAAWGRQMLAGQPGKDPMMLNELAWYIVSDEQLKDADRDADLALEAAKHANDLTKNAEPAILDTLAHAYFLKGKANEAVAASRRAVELADDAEIKAELKKSLEKFEKAANKS
jgi:tetratricopeptide (TPR) repeat protein